MLRRLAAFGLVLGVVSLSGCPSPGRPRDGSVSADAGPDFDGSIGPNSPCGPAGDRCCAGRTCELGLRCSRDVCCVQAGSTTRCDSPSDCCTGLTCSSGVCCTPRMGTCTGSADCCTGLVCSEGVCKSPESDLPGMEGCGGAMGVCCAGFTCRAGLVCNGGTCRACGDEGEPCCDGATPCSSTDLACAPSTATCVDVPNPDEACGTIDRPACGPDGMPIPGGSCAGATCEGDLRCVGGMCLDPDDEGGMDQPCGPRGGCDPGLICDYSGPVPTCEMTPDGCGRDMQMCCDTGAASGGSCEGSLNCQFGGCTACRGPSLTCLLGGILPGQGCCNGAVCRPAPIVPRCCVGTGEACTNSLDCCGFMQCQDGTCQAGREGSFCIDSSECGEGLTCQTFTCQPEGMMCIDASEPCMGSGVCCDGLACAPHRDPDMAVEPPPDECCAAGGGSCSADEDCCGRTRCEEGMCACVAMDGDCDSDSDCCDGMGCVGGLCYPTAACGEENERCIDAGPPGQCCGRLACRPDTFGASARDCCSTEACRTDEQCCGEMRCVEGSCRARLSGESCADDLDCDGLLLCIDGTCGTFT